VAKHGEGIYQFVSDRDRNRIVAVRIEPWDVDAFRAPELEAKTVRLERALENLTARRDTEVAVLNAEKAALEAKVEAVVSAGAMAALMTETGVDMLTKGDALGGEILRDGMGRLNGLKGVRPLEDVTSRFRHIALIDYLGIALNLLEDHGEGGGPEVHTLNFTREQAEGYDKLLQVALRFPEIVEAWSKRAGPAPDRPPKELPPPPAD